MLQHSLSSENSNNVAADAVYFKNLDVLRFLAAFLVVICHGYDGWTGWMGFPSFFRVNIDDVHTPNFIGTKVSQIISNFGFGVDIFFLISGFLITYLLLKEKEKFGKISIKKFIIRRSLRIWPLYYLIVIIAPFLIDFLNEIKPQWMEDTPHPNYMMYYFFLGNFDIIQTGKWMYPFAHFWSICIEEHFYIIWPFIIAYFDKKYLMNICVIVIIASISMRSYYFLQDPGNSYLPIFLDTLCRVDVIIIGAIFAFIHYTSPIKLTTSKFVRILMLFGLIWALSIDHIFNYDSLFLILAKKYVYCLWAGFLMLNFMFNEKPLFVFRKKAPCII